MYSTAPLADWRFFRGKWDSSVRKFYKESCSIQISALKYFTNIFHHLVFILMADIDKMDRYGNRFFKVFWIKWCQVDSGPVGLGYIIPPTASLQRRKTPRPPTNKQSDSEAAVIQKLWEMLSIPLLPSLQGPLWFGMIGSYLWVKQKCLISNLSSNKWLMRNWILWNRTVRSFNCE